MADELLASNLSSFDKVSMELGLGWRLGFGKVLKIDQIAILNLGQWNCFDCRGEDLALFCRGAGGVTSGHTYGALLASG